MFTKLEMFLIEYFHGSFAKSEGNFFVIVKLDNNLH